MMLLTGSLHTKATKSPALVIIIAHTKKSNTNALLFTAMTAREYNFIIVGQGLAGSILAYTLINKGQSVLVIDNNLHGSASSVAAGIINPVTGHRLNITDRFEEYYPTAKHWYQSLEDTSKITFWHSVKQIRLIKNQGQKEYLEQRTTEAAYDNLLGLEIVTSSDDGALKPNEFGAIEIQRTATVDAAVVLSTLKDWLIERQSYQCAKLDYDEVAANTSGFKVGNYRAKYLVFCEGYQAIHNPWLQHLPFKLAKGEILTVKTEPELNNSLLSWGNWLVSTNGLAKLGSNFVWNDLSLNPSQTSRESLLASLLENTNMNVKVLEHKTGIRPTTTQRKPFVGAIGKLKNAYCFNGFGSKGCLLIPHYAELFSEHLLTDQPLPQELTQWI